MVAACTLSACTLPPEDLAAGAEAPTEPVEAREAAANPLQAAARWQESLLEQLAEAWAERDVDRMEQLLGQPRRGASPGQVVRFATFASLLAAARVQADGFAHCGFAISKLAVRGSQQDFELGEPVPLELRIQAAAGEQYRIPSSYDGGVRTTFLLTTRVEDWRVDGSILANSTPYHFAAKRQLMIGDEKPFVLPLPPLPKPSAGVLIRKVKIEGALLCASFVHRGKRLAIPRLDFEALEYARFPKGFRTSKVRSDPLAVLKVAARDPARFASHILVASYFLARDFDMAKRKQGLPYLIEGLRRGAAAEKTLRASLLLVAGKQNAPAVRDRDAWLRWWDLRN